MAFVLTDLSLVEIQKTQEMYTVAFKVMVFGDYRHFQCSLRIYSTEFIL